MYIPEEAQTVENKFKQCSDIFRTRIYTEESPIVCQIHEAFGSGSGIHHNCLGCNFAESVGQIYTFLINGTPKKQIKNDFVLYILLQYLLVERMEIIFEIINLPESYKEKHFKVFQQIRKWANFIKHPKAFILTHHPDYGFEDCGFDFGKDFQLIINDQFVQQYYRGTRNQDDQKKNNKELFEKLKNKRNILVSFPDIVKLTDKLCYSIEKFVKLIIENPIYVETLNDDTTIRNYFENQLFISEN